MSRAATPSYSVEPFAPDANYPAGGETWNGNPTKVVPPGASSVGFAPNQGNAAQFHNYLHALRATEGQAAKDAILALFSDVGQLGAFNFTTATIPALGNLYQARFCNATRTWLLGGTDGTSKNTMIRTRDLRVWPSSNEIASGTQIASAGNFDVAPDGTIVQVADFTTDVCEYSGSAWTKRTGVLPAAMNGNARVAYDVTSGLWVVVGVNAGSTALVVYTSPNRTAWTARTPPTIAAGINSTSRLALGRDGAGTLVLRVLRGGGPYTSVAYSRSTDGGLTWSTPQEFAGSFAFQQGAPVWTGAVWIDVNPTYWGAGCIVRTSPDGATWSTAATLTSTDANIVNVVALGELVVGITSLDDIAFSVNQGATWNTTDVRLTNAGASPRIYAAAGRLLVWNLTGTSSYFSLATGAGVGVLT